MKNVNNRNIVMPRNQQEILNFLNDKEALNKYDKLHDNWISDLKKRGNKYDGKAHWGTLGKFIKSHKIIMLNNKTGIIHNFSDDISFLEKKKHRSKKSN